MIALWIAWNADLIVAAVIALIAGTVVAFAAWGLVELCRPYVPQGKSNTDDDPTGERQVLR